MNQEIIDESRKVNFNSNPFIWMGVGVFFWLSILGFGYIFKVVIKDFLLILDVNSVLIFWASNLGKLLLLLICSLFVLNKFKMIIIQKKQAELFLFWRIIIAFVLSQGIQFLYTYYFNINASEQYYIKSINYYHYLEDFSLYITFYETGFAIVLYTVVAIILYKKKPIN